jgi:hypothetical protein
MRGISKYLRPAFQERQAGLGELNAAPNDNLSEIREIKAFTVEDVHGAHIGNRGLRRSFVRQLHPN